MKWFLYFMSLCLIFAGIIFILYTNWLKNLLQKLLNGFNLRWLFPLPLLLGSLFIVSKDLIPYPFVALVLGILLLLKGMYLLCAPRQIDAIGKWWLDKAQDITYRFWGIIILILGITLFSWL
jgi:hypothetical protein